MTLPRPNAVQARITLAAIDPPLRRRLVVPWAVHLGQLHLVIRAAFGWWNPRLHEFRSGGLSYGDPDQGGPPESEGDARSVDETAVRLLDVGRGEQVSFSYVYDLGDKRDHTLEFARLLTLEPAPRPGQPAVRPHPSGECGRDRTQAREDCRRQCSERQHPPCRCRDRAYPVPRPRAKRDGGA
jgi:Plasmid pRiA4b ORF-3-like protein